MAYFNTEEIATLIIITVHQYQIIGSQFTRLLSTNYNAKMASTR